MLRHGGELWLDDSCSMPHTTAVHQSASVTPKYTGQQRQTCASVITSCSLPAWIHIRGGIFIVVAVRCGCSLKWSVACHAMFSVVKVTGTRRDRDACNIATWRPGVGSDDGGGGISDWDVAGSVRSKQPSASC